MADGTNGTGLDLPHLDELPKDWLEAVPSGARAAEQYEATRLMLVAFELEPRIEMSGEAIATYDRARQNLLKAANVFRDATDKTDVSKQQAAESFAGSVNEHHSAVVQYIRPFIRRATTDHAMDLAEARMLNETATEAAGRWRALEARAQEVIERVGVGRLAGHYEDEARRHGMSARWWLGGVALATASLIALVIWLMHGAYNLPEGADWRIVATQAAAKAIGIGVLSFAVSFCSRNYRARLHLQAAYRQRMASLDTYSAMAVVLKDDQDDKRIVLTELARAIFAATETGLTQGGSGDKTIIEQSIPLTSLLGGQK